MKPETISSWLWGTLCLSKKGNNSNHVCFESTSTNPQFFQIITPCLMSLIMCGYCTSSWLKFEPVPLWHLKVLFLKKKCGISVLLNQISDIHREKTALDTVLSFSFSAASTLHGHHTDGCFYNCHGRHAVGHIDDFKVLQQHILQGSALLLKMETALYSLSTSQEFSFHQVRAQKPLYSI